MLEEGQKKIIDHGLIIPSMLINAEQIPFPDNSFNVVSIGFGLRRGIVMFDFGIAFRNGMWLHTMKGFNLSFGITFVGKEKDPKK